MNGTVTAIATCGVTLCLMGTGALIAAGAPGRFSPEVVEITHVCTMGPVWQEFTYDLATFNNRDQQPLRDDGKVSLEIHATGSRYGTKGEWITVSRSMLSSGGENHLMFRAEDETKQGVMWDLVRLRHNGWGSNVFPSGSVNC